MELVLPMSYVELDQEEMLYLDGGDASNFSKNIGGILVTLAIGSITRKALGIPTNAELAKMSWNTAIHYFPNFAWKVIQFGKSPYMIGILFVATALAVFTLWNYKIFY